MLERNQARFETCWSNQFGGSFRGVYLPVGANIPAGSFDEPRHALRVRPDTAVQARDVITNAWGDVFIVGNHDQLVDQDRRLKRTLRLFKVTSTVSWKRGTTTLDPITQQPQDTGQVELGPIPVCEETLGSLERDRGSNLMFEHRHLICAAAVALGDLVDGMQVKRLIMTFGLSIAELS